MDNSNTRDNLTEDWIEENAIPCESNIKENYTTENTASMEDDEIAPKSAEVQENTSEHAPSTGKLSDIKVCKQCKIIMRGNYIEREVNGEVALFCSKKCLKLKCKTLSRLINAQPIIVQPQLTVQPQPIVQLQPIEQSQPSTSSQSLSTSTTMKITGADSLYVRVCSSCSSIIHVNYWSNISWQARDYCNGKCLTNYQMSLIVCCMECKCAISDVNNFGKFSMQFGTNIRAFCTLSCVDKYKISTEMCQFCNNDILTEANRKSLAPVTDDSITVKQFCSIGCVKNYSQFTLNSLDENEVSNYAMCFICKTFKITKVKFQHSDILTYMFCSKFCFGQYQYFNKKEVLQCYICKVLYDKSFLNQFCLYDNDVKNFCSQNCQTAYYITARVIVECNNCKVRKYNYDMIRKTYPNNQTIYACSFHCLKNSYRNRSRRILNSGSQNEFARLNEDLTLMNRPVARNGAVFNKKNTSTVSYPIESKTEIEQKKPVPKPKPTPKPKAKAKAKPKPKPKLKRKLKKTEKRNEGEENFNFGFNALKRWIDATNEQIETDSLNLKFGSKSNLMKTNVLFMTRDELHKCLIAFLNEIKGIYSSETIYKIFLDVQTYLSENKK